MADLITTSQPTIVKGIAPRSYYTRVTGFYLHVPADAQYHFATTPPLGNDIWLLRVTIRHLPRDFVLGNSTIYEIMTGKTIANTINDIGTWQHVIPNAAEGGTNITMVMWDGAHEHTEPMKKYYKGEARRFGVIAYRNGAGDDALQVTFEISEG